MANKKIYKTVIANQLNLREKPVVNSEVVTIIPNGSKLEITSLKINGFYEVKFKDYTGYVMSKYIK